VAPKQQEFDAATRRLLLKLAEHLGLNTDSDYFTVKAADDAITEAQRYVAEEPLRKEEDRQRAEEAW